MQVQSTDQKPSDPIIASLILLKAGGNQMQRIPGRKGRFDFQYVPGVGHVRSYTSIEQFHQEELEIRSIPQKCAIIARIGALDAAESARSSLARIVDDRHGHAPTKRELLCGFRSMLDLEIGRLESLGVGMEQPPEEEQPAAPALTPRQHAMQDRRAELRRAGEHHARSVVKELGLKIPLLNNCAGMIEAIVAREFAEGDCSETSVAGARNATADDLGSAAGHPKRPAPLLAQPQDPLVTAAGAATPGAAAPAAIIPPAAPRHGEEFKPGPGGSEGIAETTALLPRSEKAPLDVPSVSPARCKEKDWMEMPYKELKTLAMARGITAESRKGIAEALMKQ